jgi:hypothetical protein
MGGAVKKVASFTPAGFIGGELAKSGSEGASEWQKQYDEMGPGAKPELIERQSRLAQDGLLNDVYRLKGPEGWQKAAMEKQGLEQVAAGDLAAQQAAGAGATARSSLAMRGGLTGGSAERLAKAQMDRQMGAVQDVARQGIGQRADIGLETENRRGTTEKYNIEQALGERKAQDEYNQQKYAQDMQAWAAAKQGQATLAASRGKGDRGGVMGGAAKVIGK